VQELIFLPLVEDSVKYGFEMIETVLREDFGDTEEKQDYASRVVQNLTGNGIPTFSTTYLPLVLAGVIANNRVVMPRENVRDSLHSLSKAGSARRPEIDGGSQEIYAMLQNLIDRALDFF
jgi:hypothetical protein